MAEEVDYKDFTSVIDNLTDEQKQEIQTARNKIELSAGQFAKWLIDKLNDWR